MNYQLLIKDLCVNLNSMRKDLVRTMFERFDMTECNKVSLIVVSDLFNAKNHFDVKNGRKTADEVNQEFKHCIKLFRDLKDSDMVRSDHLIQLFQCISTSIESDYNFESFIQNCFRYNEIVRMSAQHSHAESTQSTPIYDRERQHPSQSMKYT